MMTDQSNTNKNQKPDPKNVVWDSPTKIDTSGIVWDPTVKADATMQTLSPNVQQPQSRPLDSLIPPLVRLSTGVATHSLGSNPMQAISDVGAIGEYGLPLLAAPLSPALRIPLSGLLQGTGTALKLAGQGAPPGRMLKSAGESALYGTAGQALGEIPIAALSKTAAPFAGAFDKPTADLATKYNINLPASSLSKSGFVKATEALAAKGPFGIPLVQRVENAGTRLNQIGDEIVSNLGTVSSPTEVGQAISSGLDRFESTFRQTKNDLYQRAALNKSKILFNPEKTGPLLDDMINTLDNVAGKKPALLGELRAIKSSLSGEADATIAKLKAQGYPDNVIQQVLNQTQQSGGITVATAKNTIEKLNNKVNFKNPNPIVQGYEGRIRQLAATMSDDLDSSIKTANPELGDAIDRANAYYKEGIGKLNSKWGQRITTFAQQGKLSELPSALLNSGTPAEWIPEIFNAVGDDATKQLKTATVDKILSDAKSGGTGFFTPQGLTKQIRNYGDEKLNAILGTDGTQKLKDLAQLSSSFGRGQHVAEGSQTAYVARALGMLYGLTEYPWRALRFMVGDKAFTGFVNSPAGQQWLTSGFKQIPQTVQAGIGNAVRASSQAAINQR